MKHLLTILVILLIGCQSSSEKTSTSSVTENLPKEKLPSLVSFSSDSVQQIFEKKNITGCLVLYDLKNNHYSIYNEARANTAYRSASTFKIPNSIIALETGVVKDEEQMFKWDGKKKLFKIWERDHNLRSGFKHSAVWLYQHLAKEIGETRMQEWVNKFEYGNQNIGGGIDMFWLNGDIRITSIEQIEFLKKIHLEEFPVSKRTMTIFKDIMTMEKTDDYIYRGKTGWDSTPDPDIGWFVGYIERNDNAYFFAINIEFTESKIANERKAIVNEVLKNLDLID